MAASRGNQKRHDAKTTLSVKDLIQSIEGKANEGGTVSAKDSGEGGKFAFASLARVFEDILYVSSTLFVQTIPWTVSPPWILE